MQKNNKKMTCLAAILMAALAALLIFAIVDANRINRGLQNCVGGREYGRLRCDFPKRRQGNPVGDKDDGRRIDFDRCC